MTKYWFRAHDATGAKRVWLDGWPGDMFEVLSAEQFAKLQTLASELSSFNLGTPVVLQDFEELDND